MASEVSYFDSSVRRVMFTIDSTAGWEKQGFLKLANWFSSGVVATCGESIYREAGRMFAMPLIGLAMTKWLQNYPIHTYLSPWICVLAGAGLLFITLCTVSFHSLKAALMTR